jgi:hypothetical protein
MGLRVSCSDRYLIEAHIFLANAIHLSILYEDLACNGATTIDVYRRPTTELATHGHARLKMDWSAGWCSLPISGGGSSIVRPQVCLRFSPRSRDTPISGSSLGSIRSVRLYTSISALPPATAVGLGMQGTNSSRTKVAQLFRQTAFGGDSDILLPALRVLVGLKNGCIVGGTSAPRCRAAAFPRVGLQPGIRP